MNVTLKLDGSVGERAKNCAAGAGTSFSVWVTDLVKREVALISQAQPRELLDALGHEVFEEYDREDFEFERGETPSREVTLK